MKIKIEETNEYVEEQKKWKQSFVDNAQKSGLVFFGYKKYNISPDVFNRILNNWGKLLGKQKEDFENNHLMRTTIDVPANSFSNHLLKYLDTQGAEIDKNASAYKQFTLEVGLILSISKYMSVYYAAQIPKASEELKSFIMSKRKKLVTSLRGLYELLANSKTTHGNPRPYETFVTQDFIEFALKKSSGVDSVGIIHSEFGNTLNSILLALQLVDTTEYLDQFGDGKEISLRHQNNNNNEYTVAAFVQSFRKCISSPRNNSNLFEAALDALEQTYIEIEIPKYRAYKAGEFARVAEKYI